MICNLKAKMTLVSITILLRRSRTFTKLPTSIYFIRCLIDDNGEEHEPQQTAMPVDNDGRCVPREMQACKSDIKQYRLLGVKEQPLDNRLNHLDVMCFPVLFPNGNFGKFHPCKVSLSHS